MNKWFTLKHKGTKKIISQYRMRRLKLQDIVAEWAKDGGTGDRLVKDAIRKRFKTESDADGKWTELSTRTSEERKSLGFPGSHPILYRTGDLLAEATGKKHKMPSINIGANTIETIYQVKSSKAKSHLRGANEEGKKIPVRDFLNMSTNEIDQLHNSARHEIGTKLLQIRL